ncbi:TD and POZ domain-containing protein 2 [Microplitis demolitor]|uniref:TD and POZ domain-containing protein 2 n=1 Tax=Microplitis demolitor TaxID=69319 RepID=UPI00235B6E83|nr:TD and POZ domain-containing protein 2 [Microplitis demolitor]
MKFLNETETRTIKNWENHNVVEFFSHFSNPINNITCEILMDRIDFDEIDESTLSSSSVHRVDNYLLSSLLSDVVIKIKDNKDQLPAHKLILASHSSVFERMLNTDMREAKENCICFDGFDIDTIKEVLKFMYTGQIEAENDSEVLLKVLTCAQMYQIEKLKIYCEYKLIKSLSVKNVIKILIETDNFDVPKLNEKALLYINLNKTRLSFADAAKELNNSKVLLKFFIQQTEMKAD